MSDTDIADGRRHPADNRLPSARMLPDAGMSGTATLLESAVERAVAEPVVDIEQPDEATVSAEPLNWHEEIAESSAICTAYAHLARRLATWIRESYDDTIEPPGLPTADPAFRRPQKTTIRSAARFVNHCHRIGPLGQLAALIDQLEQSTGPRPQADGGEPDQRPYRAVVDDLAERAARLKGYVGGGR